MKQVELIEAIGGTIPLYVRYKEGAELYSLGKHTFTQLAKEAGAVYNYKRCVLVNTQKVDAFLENFCESEL